MLLLMTPMMSVPTSVPPTVPTPPERLVPPMTTAAIASSSYATPSFGLPCSSCAQWTRPASAASTPQITYTIVFCHADPDAGQSRGRFIVADRVGIASAASPRQQHVDSGNGAEEEHGWRRDERNDLAAERAEGFGGGARPERHRNRRAAAQIPRHPARGAHGGQRDDEWLDAPRRNHRAIHDTHARTDAEHDERRRRNAEPAVHQQQRGHGRGQVPAGTRRTGRFRQR